MFRSVSVALAVMLFGNDASSILSKQHSNLLKRVMLSHDTGDVYDECYPSYTGCPADCDYLVTDTQGTHCDCDSGELDFCKPTACHSNGCDQCEPGYFKRDYASPCVSCADVFGAACKSCADNEGCNECIDPNLYERVVDTSCESGTSSGFHYCRPIECTDRPTHMPTDRPTESPTDKPTQSPTEKPTNAPTDKPTQSPTDKPTESPTNKPTASPDEGGIGNPGAPSSNPTQQPTEEPTDDTGGETSGECPSNTDNTFGSIIECDNDPCQCDEEALHCGPGLCHENGCDQCEEGYFKLDYNYKCAQCQDIFGDACKQCTDFLGCQQCDAPATRQYDPQCDLYYCQYP